MKSQFFLLFVLLGLHLSAQDDLLAALEEEAEPVTRMTEATFKATRLMNGHTVETRKKGELIFLISHRFGELTGGAYELWGLDQASIRLGLEYAVFDRLTVGVGRSSFQKTYDGFVKYKLVGQSQGKNAFPFTATWLSTMTIKTLRTTEYELEFSDKLAYTHQLLIARKLGPGVSIQLMPSFVHFNTISEIQSRNDQWALGAGGRFKLTNRVSLNLEYYYQFNPIRVDTYNSIAIGVDIETGGHVFQLQFTNSTPMIEKGFIAETTNDFFAGDIHFGFNISRSFQLVN